MSELRCHYCGAGCEDVRYWDRDCYDWRYRMTCNLCKSTGPGFASPEAAVAAHATVAPAPRWTSEPPKEGGRYYCDAVDCILPFDAETIRTGLIHGGLLLTREFKRFAGPIPEPADAAEGGGA